jgi:hypothetical protein
MIRMTIDVEGASDFMVAHARMLDRRRFELLFGKGDPDATLAALNAYRNPDGGYGWGLEPDLRAVESQPAAALHAFEVFEELAPIGAPQAAALCDWLAATALPGGGLPFALPPANPTACAPFFAGADATVSSLHITAAVAARAHQVGLHDPDVAAHPWLGVATSYCLDAIARLGEAPHAIELMFVLHLLEALHEVQPDVGRELSRVAAFLPPNATVHVGGGLDDEYLRPLDYSPRPSGALRTQLDPTMITADLDRLEQLQQGDGGWVVDFRSYSPAADLEWRGYATVEALSILHRNGRLASSGR